MTPEAGWAPSDENEDTCFNCGSSETTPPGAGCWWCEPNDHPEPDEIAAYRQTPEEEAAMMAKAMLYLTTKLTEWRFTGKMT